MPYITIDGKYINTDDVFLTEGGKFKELSSAWVTQNGVYRKVWEKVKASGYRFAAIGYVYNRSNATYTTFLSVSKDGMTWDKIVLPDFTSYSSANAIAYNTNNDSIFVGNIYDGYLVNLMTMSKTRVALTQPSSSKFHQETLSYLPSIKMFTFYDYGANVFYYSSDGITWNSKSHSADKGYYCARSIFDMGNNVYISNGMNTYNGGNAMLYKLVTDDFLNNLPSSNQTLINSFTGSAVGTKQIAKLDDDNFFLFAKKGSYYHFEKINANDGSDTQISSSVLLQATMEDVAAGNGKVVATYSMGGSNGDTMLVRYSADGVNTTSYTTSLYAGQSIAFNDGMFITLGTYTNYAYYSTDGVNWNKCTNPFTDISCYKNTTRDYARCDGKIYAIGKEN